MQTPFVKRVANALPDMNNDLFYVSMAGLATAPVAMSHSNNNISNNKLPTQTSEAQNSGNNKIGQ